MRGAAAREAATAREAAAREAASKSAKVAADLDEQECDVNPFLSKEATVSRRGTSRPPAPTPSAAKPMAGAWATIGDRAEATIKVASAREAKAATAAAREAASKSAKVAADLDEQECDVNPFLSKEATVSRRGTSRAETLVETDGNETASAVVGKNATALTSADQEELPDAETSRAETLVETDGNETASAVVGKNATALTSADQEELPDAETSRATAAPSPRPSAATARRRACVVQTRRRVRKREGSSG